MWSAALVCRFVLATAFVLAGVAKLPRRREFELAVERYRLLPTLWSRRVARVLPVFELLSGFLLGVGLLTVPTAVLLMAALATFTIAVTINLLRGRRIDCGCFGPAAPERITWWTVVRNLALLGMALVVTLESPQVLSLDSVWMTGAGGGSRRSAWAFFIVGTTCVLATLLLREAVAGRRAVRKAAALAEGSGG